LNFWGTWCGPCLKEIPSIIELYHKNSDQINLINVGCENTNDGIEKAKKITFEKKMEWLQFYEITGGIDTFSNLLNVYTFPTLIVFDNTGLIIARETDLGNVEIIKEKLKLN
jgi:thiol-disulfide isomerase/thioredoxin